MTQMECCPCGCSPLGRWMAVLATLLTVCTLRAQEKTAEKPVPPKLATIEDAYRGYRPDYLTWGGHGAIHRGVSAGEQDISSERHFFSLNLISESDRVYALVKAAIENEEKGDYRLAMDMYQQVIDTYPDSLFRVSEMGVFVPATRYCQLRLLRFPKPFLDLYRTEKDAQAREAFELARRRYSLEGLAYIRDAMLATSYGGQALLMLGDAALDGGRHLEALEYYVTVRDYFPDDNLRTPELRLKIALCRKALGEKEEPGKQMAEFKGASQLPPAALKRLEQAVAAMPVAKIEVAPQRASAPHIAMDDYAPFPPTEDPLGLQRPIWERDLGGSRDAVFVFTQPVVTEHSAIYRHRNVIYSRSLLNGELRWQFDDGGRRTWQNTAAGRQPMDDVVVGNGLVYAPLFRQGANLVAVDEITGQLRWSYGPMSATTEDETRMSFGASPTLGGANVFAGYVLDNIRGASHVDSEYGMMAFDAISGEVRWRTPLCRLRPGKDSFSLGRGGRNLIRSFHTPPLYHEGTVYHTTNAGAIAALDALSGQIKWIMRYPYILDLHDATRGWGGKGGNMRNTNEMYGPDGPMLWYNQRPLMIGDHLYMMPINADAMFKLDRRTGRIVWSRLRRDRAFRISHIGHAGAKGGPSAFFVGPTPTGEMLEVYSWRSKSVFLFDPKTGQDTWQGTDTIGIHTNHPTVYMGFGTDFNKPMRFVTLGINDPRWAYQTCVRPFLSTDGTVSIGQHCYRTWPHFAGTSHLAHLDLKKRRVEQRRHFISGGLLAACADAIEKAPHHIKGTEALPNPSPEDLNRLKILKTIAADTVHQNEHPPFMPFARMTFHRFGSLFELRASGSTLSMLYDREKTHKAVASVQTPSGLLTRAELAIGDRRFNEAAGLLEACLAATSPDDIAFRTMANQQLYRTRKRLAQGRIRARDANGELEQALGMSRSATTLDNEIETLFAVAEARRRQNEWKQAEQAYRKLIERYGYREHGAVSLALAPAVAPAVSGIVSRAAALISGVKVSPPLQRAAKLSERAMPLYTGALSPLERDLQVGVGDWAAAGLLSMRRESPQYAADLDRRAEQELKERSGEEVAALLAVFPGAPAAQQALDRLLAERGSRLDDRAVTMENAAALRKSLWLLADTALVSGLKLSDTHARRLLASPQALEWPSVSDLSPVRSNNMAEARETAWMLLDHEGEGNVGGKKNPFFLGGRVRKRTDTQFVLYCLDQETGAPIWKASEQRGETRFEEIRLSSDGAEPGFLEVYLIGDLAVTRGLFDVLAFGLEDGKLRWRYAVPSGFEILSASRSGDLLALSGQTETIALYLPTADPRGEVVWQRKEEGAPYAPAYFNGNRWISVREMPFSVTVRDRGTGKLKGRLDIPDLLMNTVHPVLESGPRQTPFARDGQMLALYSGHYIFMVDTDIPRILWKRGMGEAYRPMRLALGDGLLAVVKNEHDRTTLAMVAAADGRTLWQTDAKTQIPAPLYSMRIRNGNLYGLALHPGQAFIVSGLDGASGKPVFTPNTQDGYQSKPSALLRPQPYTDTLVAEIKDRQDFELKVFDLASGKLRHTIKVKGTGDFGEYGRASATVAHGGLALLGGNTLMLTTPKAK